MLSRMNCVTSILLLLGIIQYAQGHGYLSTPMVRGSFIRVTQDKLSCPYSSCGNYNTHGTNVDYDPNGLSAGGREAVWAGCPEGQFVSCRETGNFPIYGMCGDPKSATQDHVEGGKYSSGWVNAVYSPGQTIPVTLTLTTNHMGYFEFFLWVPNTNDYVTPTTTSNSQVYRLKLDNPRTDINFCRLHTIDPAYMWCLNNTEEVKDYHEDYYLALVLPVGVACKRCVIQWQYTTANSPGYNPEMFWSCADVAIRSAGPYINNVVTRTDVSGGTYVASATSGNPGATTVTSMRATTQAQSTTTTTTVSTTGTTTSTSTRKPIPARPLKVVYMNGYYNGNAAQAVVDASNAGFNVIILAFLQSDATTGGIAADWKALSDIQKTNVVNTVHNNNGVVLISIGGAYDTTWTSTSGATLGNMERERQPRGE